MKRRRNCRRIFPIEKDKGFAWCAVAAFGKQRDGDATKAVFSPVWKNHTALCNHQDSWITAHTINTQQLRQILEAGWIKKRQMHAKGQQGRRGRHIIEQAREQSRATQLDSEGRATPLDSAVGPCALTPSLLINLSFLTAMKCQFLQPK